MQTSKIADRFGIVLSPLPRLVTYLTGSRVRHVDAFARRMDW